MTIKIKNKSQLVAINNLIETLSGLNLKQLEYIFDSLTFSFDLPELLLEEKFKIIIRSNNNCNFSFFQGENLNYHQEVFVYPTQNDLTIEVFKTASKEEKYFLSDIFEEENNEEEINFNIEQYHIFNLQIKEYMEKEDIDINRNLSLISLFNERQVVPKIFNL